MIFRRWVELLSITIPPFSFFDERTEEFIEFDKPTHLQLEHSLLSISKWESKWHKPFIGNSLTPPKTNEELIDYIRCMTLTQKVDPQVYLGINNDVLQKVTAYIEDSMTATTFSDEHNKKFNSEIITAEIIYYWMVALKIPFECQKWHLNKLIALIKVVSLKQQPPKKIPKGEYAKTRRGLNAARKKKYHTHG
jgi:hypothetical protein